MNSPIFESQAKKRHSGPSLSSKWSLSRRFQTKLEPHTLASGGRCNKGDIQLEPQGLRPVE